MKMMFFKLSSIALVLVSGCVFSFFLGFLRLNYPSLKTYPVQGIDVSHHQGEINWSSIPKDKVKFVYIKATEGGDWRDPMFTQNWTGAKNSGFEVGAYHFFTLCRDGITQAKNFMNLVDTSNGMLPPVIDLEYVGNCAARPSREEFLLQLSDFVQEWQTFYMRKPVFYTTKEFYHDYLEGTDFVSYSLWIRDIFAKPDVKDYPSMVLWQYADNARIDGIKGPVDLNVAISGTIK